MRAGPSSRNRKTQKAYDHYSHHKPEGCDFCEFSGDTPQVIASTDKFWIVKNIFAYSHWDDTPVEDHLMIVPKRHIEGLHELTPAEAAGFFKLVSRFERLGYSFYARTPRSIAKSIPHQHTHLIKLGDNFSRFHLHIRKPHFVIHG